MNPYQPPSPIVQQAAQPPVGEGTGTAAWALGFLAFVPIPVLGQIGSAVAMAVSYRSQRRKGAVAAENARRAANWGLTYLTVTVVLFGTVAAMGAYINTIDDVAARRDAGVLPLTLLGLWLLVSLLHVVLVVIGTTKAAGGRIFNNPIQIPFLRRTAA
jgi:uncharacterized Tic20 family protein